MSVELNCAQGSQSSLLCKRSIELVELFPWRQGWEPNWQGEVSGLPRTVRALGRRRGLGSWKIRT